MNNESTFKRSTPATAVAADFTFLVVGVGSLAILFAVVGYFF